jgi:hypothetical protein
MGIPSCRSCGILPIALRAATAISVVDLVLQAPVADGVLPRIVPSGTLQVASSAEWLDGPSSEE